jgi:predicted Fe-Mo cluster-binding NifX family protein
MLIKFAPVEKTMDYGFLRWHVFGFASRSMKVAIPYSEDRTSPLFDVSRNLLLLNLEAGVEQWREKVRLDRGDLVGRAKQVASLGARVVICGAVSKPFDSLLTSLGVWLIPNTCGPLEEVLRAFIAGELTEEAYLMPGANAERRKARTARGQNMGGTMKSSRQSLRKSQSLSGD